MEMTAPRASALARARRERHARERRERIETFLFALMVLAMLAAFALAGTIDLADRTEGAGASMLPSASWMAGEKLRHSSGARSNGRDAWA